MSSMQSAAFARRVLDHNAKLDDGVRQCVIDAINAGEAELAAVTVVEMAPVTVDDLDELERLAIDFDHVDRPIAEEVIAKRRKELAATAT